jgi:CO/xanthine dehydrogenase FAD-binding subunit
MKPPAFEYHDPASVEEALDLLAHLGDDVRPLAGGQSLVPLLNLRLARPAHLVDLNRIGELSQVVVVDGGVAVGSLVRQRAGERSNDLREHCPLVVEAISQIGHLPIRNRGTIGGSLAHADPAAELPAVALALGAELVVRSATQSRRVPASEFFLGYFTTAVAPDELLVETVFPARAARAGWAFEEVSRRPGDFAMVGVACAVEVGADDTIQDVRLAFSGVAATPQRGAEAERVLIGARPAPDVVREAAAVASSALDPPGDLHATPAYRRHVARVLVERAVGRALARAGSTP